MKKRKANSSSLDAVKVIADPQEVKENYCDSFHVIDTEDITCMHENEVYHDACEGGDALYDTLNEIDIFFRASSGDESGINSDFVLFDFNDSGFVITVDAPKKNALVITLSLFFSSGSEIQANIKVSEVIIHELELIKQRKFTTTKRVFGVDLAPLSEQLSTMQSNIKAGENKIYEMYLERRDYVSLFYH